jgi:hypothetical protein
LTANLKNRKAGERTTTIEEPPKLTSCDSDKEEQSSRDNDKV